MVHEVQMGKLRKRMSFSRIEEVLEMPNLIEVQKNSYQRFLENSLREAFDFEGTPLKIIARKKVSE